MNNKNIYIYNINNNKKLFVRELKINFNLILYERNQQATVCTGNVYPQVNENIL